MKIVLDHGMARLVDSMGSDLSIVRAARVSHDADWRAGEDTGSDARLIDYMARNHHSTPFEAVTFTFEVKCPIFVVRQWHRHRTFSYNEVSARYTELPEEFYIPDPANVGKQSTSNKQARDIGTLEAAGLDSAAADFIADLQRHSEEGFRLYQFHLGRGVPRELARCFLGLNVYTRMFATVNLHNLFHFLGLRLHSHAQFEIRVYAQALLELIEPVVPVAVAAFRKYRLTQT